MEGLDRYRWSGHSVLMGKGKRSWQAREEVLSYFGGREGIVKRRYRQFISEVIGLGKRGELSGETRRGRKKKTDEMAAGMGDSRILGCGEFVERVLAGKERLVREPTRLRRRRVNVELVLEFIGKEFGVSKEEIMGGGRRREISLARSVFCYVLLRRLGMTGRQLSETLQMTPAGVHFASSSGEIFVRDNSILEKSLKNYLTNLTTLVPLVPLDVGIDDFCHVPKTMAT